MKKVFKFMATALVATAMLLGGTSQAFADNLSNKDLQVIKTTIVNPIYADEYDKGEFSDEIAQYDLKATVTPYKANTIGEAVVYLRKEMVKRNTGNIPIIIKAKGINRINAGEIFNEAIAYSDNAAPNEGDYLLSHFRMMGVSTSYASTQDLLTAVDSDYTVDVNILLEFQISYLSTYQQELMVDQAVKKILNQLNVYDKDEYTKIKAVHDYIVQNIDYDYSLSRYSAYNAIIDKSTVCQGFASLTYRMLKELGVGVRYITGVGNDGLHAWNIVRIGGKWYNIDNTWDENTNSSRYFLKCNSEFGDHTRNSQYTTSSFNTQYPMASSSFVYDPELYSDYKDHWGRDCIKTAMEKGWVSTTNRFRPDAAITRAEFVKIVNKAFGYTYSGTIKYTDVSTAAWYYNEIAVAAKAGYISTANTKFRPNDPISREEAAAIVTSITNKKDSNLDKLNKYLDRNKVSAWAKTSVEGAIEAGYMGSGSSYFRPIDNITRAEAVATLSRIK